MAEVRAGAETGKPPGPGLIRLLAGFAAVTGTALALELARARIPEDWRLGMLATVMLVLPLLLGANRSVDPLRPDWPRTAWGALEGLAAAAVLLTLFFVGVGLFWRFNNPGPGAGKLARAALFQLALVAVPEEFFFRAFLQRGLEGLAVRKIRLAGARVGWGLPAAAVLFALAHLAIRPPAAALLRFFPGLAMGWLWARRESLAGPVIFHAACNLGALWVAPGVL